MMKKFIRFVFIVVILIGVMFAAQTVFKLKVAKKVTCENTTKELTVYENTAIVFIKDPTGAKKNTSNPTEKVKAAPAVTDITAVGSVHTVESAVHVPTITTENKDIRYFCPCVYSGGVKKFTLKKVIQTSAAATAEKEKATKANLAVSYNNKKTVSNNLVLHKTGTYEVVISITDTTGKKIKDTFKVTVKAGAINDDYINGTAPLSNLMVNPASSYMTSLHDEYETEIPFAIANYKSALKSEEKAKQAFLTDNATMLLDFNRIRKWRGEEALDIEGIYATYGTDKALQAAVAKSGSSEYNGSGRIVTKTSSKARQAFDLVNKKRAEVGVKALAWNDKASKAAEIRAREIVSNFSHDSASRARDGCAGENIAYGQPTASSVVTDWYNSEGHRRNMLDPSYTGGAIACYEKNGLCYWVQLFVW